MKTRYIKGILTLLMAWIVLPMMGQDFMNVYFKDGTFRIFHFQTIDALFTSPFDGDGVQHIGNRYQHVKTKYEEFVFDINNIDSISFTKYNESTVQKNTSAAMNSVLPALSDCNSAADASEKIDIIKQSEGVETAWVEGNALFVKIKDSETIVFQFNNNPNTNANSENNAPKKLKAINASPRKLKKPDGSPYKAVIANQQHYDVSEWRSNQRSNFMYPLQNNLQKMGYEADYLPNDTRNVDLDFFYNDIYDYDVILLSTHGGYSQSTGHRIVSGQTFGKIQKRNLPEGSTAYGEITTAFNSEYEKIFNDSRFSDSQDDLYLTYSEEYRLENGAYHNYWVSYVGIKETFFNHTVRKRFSNPNSFFFNAACMSLMNGNELADILREHRGLGTYVGYSQSNYYGQEAGCTMLNNMLYGLSAEKTYEDLGMYNFGRLGKELHENTYDVTGTYKDENIIKFVFNQDLNQYVESERYTASVSLVPEGANSFITPTNTNPIDETKANNDFKANQYVEVEGLTTTANINSVSYGFEYGTDEDFNSKKTVAATEKMQLTASIDKGNVLFKGQLTDLEPGNTYYYRAYTYDGMHHNYGDPKNFKIEQPTNDRILMLSKEVNGATYKIYKQVLDENNVHVNPDGWKCYKSALTLDITKNGNTQTYTIDDNIYLDKQESHHGGQRPCLLLDFSANQMFVFINSKDANSNNYTMDGHAYRSSLNNISFTLEKVFTGANWGWSPYFTEASGGQLKLRHFSFAGYYAVYSTRSSNGSWSNARGESIYPDDFDAQSLEAGNVLVVGGSTPQGYTSCPDSNHPHMIDMGLPSGTKWACCNVGADKPEADGHYYSWGEIQTKNTYNWDTYEYGYYNFDEDWSHLVNIGSDIGGTQYDAATVQWGESWRMPTKKQYVELIENTNPTWTTQNGRKGFLFTSSNGGTLFLPASGYYGDNEVHQYDYYGNYWSSVLYDEVPAYAHVLYFQPNKIEKDKIAVRYYGLPVRPVRK